MCVGCGGRDGKPALVRVVRSPGGDVAVDPTGSAPGRGAYLHPVASCVEVAVARGSLARALRAGVAADGAARLRDEIERETRSG
jgi:predicted RNA-binding protein YlxR (DUF448 family)